MSPPKDQLNDEFNSHRFEERVITIFDQAVSEIQERKHRNFFRNKGNMKEIIKFQNTMIEFFEEEIQNPFEHLAQRVLRSPCLKECLVSIKEPSAEHKLKEAAFELIEEIFFVEKCRAIVIETSESLSSRLKGLEVNLLQIILDKTEENKGVYRLFASDVLVVKLSLLKQVHKKLTEMKAASGQTSGKELVQLSDDFSTAENLLHRCQIALGLDFKDMVDFCKTQHGLANPETIDVLTSQLLNSPNFLGEIDQFFFDHLDMKNEEIKHKHNLQACYSKFDIILMYIQTTCVLTSLYGFGITSYRYLNSMHVNTGISGVLQAVTPVTAAFYTVFLNYMTKDRHYKSIMIFNLILVIGGHVSYFVAEVAKKSSDGLGIFLIGLGRALIGAGAGRMLSRKYLSVFIAYWAQSYYQFIFVTLSCIALCLGPGISSILEYAIPEEDDSNISDRVLKPWNILSFVFIFVFSAMLIPFVFWYKGTDINDKAKNIIVPTTEQSEHNSPAEYPIAEDSRRLNDIISQTHNPRALGPSMVADVPIANQVVENPKQHFTLTATFPNWQIVYSSFVLFFLKLMQEGFFTELPQLSINYYGHSTKWTGFYYLLSILYLLPSFFGSVWLSKKVSDASILMLGLVLLLIACLIKINYEYDKPMREFTFYFGSSLYFAASLIAEAGVSAIIPKVATERVKASFFNAGMIAGTLDTVGRAIGNALFTLYSLTAGKPAVPFYQYIVNGSLAFIMIITTAIFWRYLTKYSYVKISDEALTIPAEAVPLNSSNKKSDDDNKNKKKKKTN